MAYGLSQSVVLNGSTQYLSAADSASLSPTGSQTHEGWINFTSLPSSGTDILIFSKYAAAGSQRGIAVSYENSGGTLQFNVRTSANGSTVASGTFAYTFSTNTWYFVRFVMIPAITSMDIYVNDPTTKIGTISTLANGILDNTATYQLGFNTDISGHFAGEMSLWRVWNVVHTTADQCTVYGTTTSNMQAEWSLDGVLTDSSGNSNTFTNNGSATFTNDLPITCFSSASGMMLMGVG